MSKKLAIVTGASSGIGYNLAKVFAEHGYDLVIGAEDDAIHKAAEDFAPLGSNVTPLQVDLATYDGCEVFWGSVEALGRKVDAVALNAGLGGGGSFVERELDKEIALLRLNVESTVHIAKHAVRKLHAQGEGKILITSSILAELVAPREAVYAATKAFGLSFAKSLRYELKDTGVTVTVLQPGAVDTEIFERAGLEDTKISTEGRYESTPYDVALQGFKAMVKGEEHVYAASMKAKLEGALLPLLPDGIVAKAVDDFMNPAEKKQL